MKKFKESDYYKMIQGKKKHLKKSRALKRRLSKAAYHKRELRSFRKKKIDLINIDSTTFSKYFVKSNNSNNKWSINADIKVPVNFCMYSAPENCISWLSNFAKILRNPRRNLFRINHKYEERWSLGSEVILGLLAHEITKCRFDLGLETQLSGKHNRSKDHQLVLESVGIISELDKNIKKNIDKVHVFKQDCYLNETSSSTAEDLKTETAIKFVRHIQDALLDHRLKLLDEASQNIKGSLGEILDNAAEHGGLTAPIWYVRGYINNNSQTKDLELMVMNIGKSIADTFLDLADDHQSKKQVLAYADYHKYSSFTKEQLITVAALQGKVSSKNHDESDTRGQGTVRLIEMFEHIFAEYAQLRCPDKTKSAIMNLISGSVVVKFDGTYLSQVETDDDGGERVTIAFNREKSLKSKPDRNYVSKLEKSYFPGVMINIKIPLSGSVVPIKDKS